MKCIFHFIFVRTYLTDKDLFGFGSVCIGYFGKFEEWGLQKIFADREKCRKLRLLGEKQQQLPFPSESKFFLNYEIMLCNYELELLVGFM